MQHSQDFKRRSVNFSVDGRQLRAYRRSKDRKSWRDDIVMKRRSSNSDILDQNIGFATNKFKALAPLKEKNEEVGQANQKEPVKAKKLTGSEERKLQLMKYKERKQLLKDLEKQNRQNKPIFKVSKVKHVYDPLANIPAVKQKAVKPIMNENKRITRSAAKLERQPGKANNKITEKQNLKAKSTKRVKERGKKDEPKIKKAKMVSFAPDGFQFTAPMNLKFPSPRKALVASENQASKTVESTLTSNDYCKNRQSSDDISMDQKSDFEFVSSDDEVQHVERQNEKEANDAMKNEENLPSTGNLDVSIKNENQPEEKSENKTDIDDRTSSDGKEDIKDLVQTPKIANFLGSFVTTTRGSSSKKKRQSTLRRSLLDKKGEKKAIEEKYQDNPSEDKESAEKSISEETSTDQKENSTTKTEELDRFKELVVRYKGTIESNINFWIGEKQRNENLPEIAGNEIDSAVGMAELLMSQRFTQFEGLIAESEFDRGTQKVTCDDLQGFWDMIYHQITNIEMKFDKLHTLKECNWTHQTPKPKKRKRRSKKATPKRKAQATTKGLRAHIAAARKTKKEETLKSENNEIENLETPKIQETSTDIPIAEPSCGNRRILRSSAHREGSISYLLRPTIQSSDDDVFYAETEDVAVNKIVKSVLKSSSNDESLNNSTPDAKNSENKNIHKKRRSVRFAFDTKTEDNDTPVFPTTPFTTRRKSFTSSSSSTSEEKVFTFSDSFTSIPEITNHTTCTPRMNDLSLMPTSTKKKVSLLPLSDVVNIPPFEGDLISFSPAKNVKQRRRKSSNKAN